MLQRSAILLLTLFSCLPGFAQFDEQLRKPNEEIVFACQLKNLKWVAVCREKNGKYLVYRFGTKAKIEMQYPAVPDASSWQKFTFNGYVRGGGKANAAMHFGYLKFFNNNVEYELYDLWSSEDDKEEWGVLVKQGKKTIDMKGNLKNKKGSLLELIYEDKIKKEDEN